jgi:hypothetical protein
MKTWTVVFRICGALHSCTQLHSFGVPHLLKWRAPPKEWYPLIRLHPRRYDPENHKPQRTFDSVIHKNFTFTNLLKVSKFSTFSLSFYHGPWWEHTKSCLYFYVLTSTVSQYRRCLMSWQYLPVRKRHDQNVIPQQSRSPQDLTWNWTVFQTLAEHHVQIPTVSSGYSTPPPALPTPGPWVSWETLLRQGSVAILSRPHSLTVYITRFAVRLAQLAPTTA